MIEVSHKFEVFASQLTKLMAVDNDVKVVRPGAASWISSTMKQKMPGSTSYCVGDGKFEFYRLTKLFLQCYTYDGSIKN